MTLWQRNRRVPPLRRLSRPACLRPFLTLPHTSSYKRFLLFSLFIALTTIFFRRRYPVAELSPNPMNDYEPLDYDPPNESTSSLMFTNDSDYMSSRFSANNNRSTLLPFDHSSTSSNASGADENNNTHLDNRRHSRPSSVV